MPTTTTTLFQSPLDLEAPVRAREFTVAPRPAVAPRIQWRRAWNAVSTLMADPERTEMAFEAVAALSGYDWEKLFQRFAADPDGRALLVEQPSLLRVLADRPALRALPEGSFGRTYAAFMDAAQLDADGLVEAERDSMAAEEVKNLDPQRAYLSDRVRDIHDLWHVLSGYGRDEAGEAANLAFSHAQLRLRGMALILFGIAINHPPGGGGRLQWLRYLIQAWRRGRQTAWLPPVHYERLLPLPLEQVRKMVRIRPAGEVHPGGIIVANGTRAVA